MKQKPSELISNLCETAIYIKELRRALADCRSNVEVKATRKLIANRIGQIRGLLLELEPYEMIWRSGSNAPPLRKIEAEKDSALNYSD
jgi:hypothetical protein